MADETLRQPTGEAETAPTAANGEQPAKPRSTRGRRTKSEATGAPAPEAPPAEEAPAPKPRARRKKADADGAAGPPPEAVADAPPAVRPAEAADAPEGEAPPRRRRSPRRAEPVASSDAPVSDAPASAAPPEPAAEAEPAPPRPRSRGAVTVIDLTSPGRPLPERPLSERPAPERPAPERPAPERPATDAGERGPGEPPPRREPPPPRDEPPVRESQARDEGRPLRPEAAERPAPPYDEPYEPGRRKRKRDRRKKDRREGGPPGPPQNGQGAPYGGPPGGGPVVGPPGGYPQGGYPQAGNQQGGNPPGGFQQGYQQGGFQNGPPPAGDPFEGMLELIGDKKFGFIRGITPSLLKGDNDPFMPPPLIQKYNLRDGVALKGTITRGRKGAWQVARVDEVMGMSPEEWKDVPDFDSGMVIYPEEKLNLVIGPSDVSMRVVDLVAPIGKGQRSLIVAPPRAGKTIILKKIAEGLAQNHPEVELIALLIDERPEEVTDFRRNTKARVFASSNDAGEDNHVRVATLAFEYARRFAELGKDVVILLDSLTRLGRTFNLWGGNSGRTMSGGLDARALLIPRKIFGAARKIEGGGSLTIIATALVETGSRMDDVIFEEFKGTGNAEIVLDRELADKRIYPAINIRKSGTRNEERLMPEEQIRQRHMLFRVLNARHPVEAMQALVRQIQLSPTNVHLLNELIPEQY
jgi:transcription termination factor Rho